MAPSFGQQLRDGIIFPQVIKNVHVREKKPFHEVPSIAAAIQNAEKDLAESGRVVVRYSGTERLCRVMIEAESDQKMKFHAQAIGEVCPAVDDYADRHEHLFRLHSQIRQHSAIACLR